MPTLHTIYILIFVITGISIILSFIDWFYLLSLSGKISSLEQEIEKKAQEFDSFKKERSNNQLNHPVLPPVENQQAMSPNSFSDETIQIIRNVRGNFEKTEQLPQYKTTPDSGIYDQSTPEHPYLEDSAPEDSMENPAPVLDTGVVEPYVPPPTQTPFIFDTPDFNAAEPQESSWPEISGYGTTGEHLETPVFPIEPTISENLQPDQIESDVMEVVHEQQPQEVVQEHPVLPLYSDITKDADFIQLWKMLSEILASKNKPVVSIDFSGIHFIYDKELEYLDKIYHIIAGQNGSLYFINCDPELVSLLSMKPHLLQLLN